MENSRPNYKKIFEDIIRISCPEKKQDCIVILRKPKLTTIDVIKINTIIFGSGNNDTSRLNQMHRSYNENDILEILSYQIKNCLNNTQLAFHFKLSRNTVAKWKKEYSGRIKNHMILEL